MIPLLTLLLVGPAELPWLGELDRFPGAKVCHAQVNALTRLYLTLKQQPPTKERMEALHETARQLAAWEMLLEAREGLGLDESAKANEEVRRRALERLRAMLGDADWRAGRMP